MKRRHGLLAGAVVAVAALSACSPSAQPGETSATSPSVSPSTASPIVTTSSAPSSSTPAATTSPVLTPTPIGSASATSSELFAAYVAAVAAIEHATATDDLTSKDLSDTLTAEELTSVRDGVVKAQAKGWISAGSNTARLLSAAASTAGLDATVKACVSNGWHFVVKKTGKPVDKTNYGQTIETAKLVLIGGQWKLASQGIQQVASC